MTFHLVSLPHTQTTKAYSYCAFTQKVINFAAMMKSLGHTVYLYASEDNDAPCDELITCINKEDKTAAETVNASWDWTSPRWVEFNHNAIQGIAKRKQPKDIICLIGGLAHKPIADAHPDLMSVEFGIGYQGTFAKFRVFESYAWMHFLYGRAQASEGNFYDAVIPNYYKIEEFPIADKKEDYYFFIGRLDAHKGLKIAVETCKALGKTLKVAGPGTPPAGVDYVGVVDIKTRGELMSKAIATFVPTQYIEPFGGVTVESMLCGTPIITTDWGAFPEINIQGVTGYRCRTLGEFIWAAKNVSKLDPQKIRQHAIDRYSMDNVRFIYQDYFTKLMQLWDKGWYDLTETDPSIVSR